MGFTIRGEVSGLGPVLQAMQGMKLGLRNKALRRGITKASRLVAKAAKAKLHTKSGNNILKKSIGAKVVVKGDRVLGIVGPRNGFKQQIGVRHDGSPVYEDPAKIAHLKENGRAAVAVTDKKVLSDGREVFGTSVKAVPAEPFMRPAWDENKDAVVNIIADECWLELAKWSRT